ncbi:MAG: nucleotidyltransferase domain-containing protein [Promethearchaeota archaeon]
MESFFSKKIEKINSLSPQLKPYLIDIYTIIDKYIGFRNIYSIILFGSHVIGDNTNDSDCDLLIIIKDKFYRNKSRLYLKNLEKVFLIAEKKNGFGFIGQKNGNMIDIILNVVERSTGMYSSHFICRKSAWNKQIFSKIFGVNRVLASFLAPGGIVLKGVKSSNIVLFGVSDSNSDSDSDFDKKKVLNFKPETKFYQIIKSLMMNEFTAISSIILLPLLRSIKYSLESFKWSIKNSYIFLLNRTATIKKISELFERISLKKSIFSRFIQLREGTRSFPDIKFTLFVPYYVLMIHLSAIRYKKIFKEKSA